MPVCVRIRGKRKKLCSGDLNQLIQLQNRAIAAPQQGGVDFTEVFQDKPINTDEASPYNEGDVWAFIETTGGKTIFDGVNDRVVSHDIYLRFVDGVTAETWVVYNGNRYDVVTVENLDEANEYLRLRCNLRGPETQSNTAV